MDNVLLTPHVGGSTEEAQENIGIEVARSSLSTATTDRPSARSIFPKSPCRSIPASIAYCTFTAISPACSPQSTPHFSDEAINIAGQYLQTDPGSAM